MADEYTPQAWRITGYYPEQYAKSMSALGIGIDYSDEDFDRYEAEFRADLAEHDAEVAKAAVLNYLRTKETEHRTADDAIRDIESRARDLFNSEQWERLPDRAKANYRLHAASFFVKDRGDRG